MSSLPCLALCLLSVFIVRGLGKKFGFQPKMPRLRVVHSFLWYLIYGHPQKHNSTDSHFTSQAADNSPTSSYPVSVSVDSQAADCTQSKLDVTSFADEEEKVLKDESKPAHSESKETGERKLWFHSRHFNAALSLVLNHLFPHFSALPSVYVYWDLMISGSLSSSSVFFCLCLTVYVDEESWKRFVPPVRVHKDFGSGWAMVGDMLLCLPLSVFIQFTQINYKVNTQFI